MNGNTNNIYSLLDFSNLFMIFEQIPPDIPTEV